MFGLTTTRRLRAELAAAKAETDRQRTRAAKALDAKNIAVRNREQILRQLAEAGAANTRLHDRNLELGRRLSALGESDPEYAAALERRITRLLKVIDRIAGAGLSEHRRANHLQRRLDQSIGLDSPAVLSKARRPVPAVKETTP